MSFRITSAMLKVQGFTSTEKFILTVLADFADEHGEKIYPANATICERTGYSERTVRAVLSDLVKRGFLAITYGGGRVTNTVKLNLEKIGITPATVAPEPGRDCPPPRQQLPVSPAGNAPKNINKNTLENAKDMGSGVPAAPPEVSGSVELLDFATPTVTPAVTPEPVKRFKPPTLDEVKAYWQGKGHPGGDAQAEAFWDHHETWGWKNGPKSMKNWQRATNTWVRNISKFSGNRNATNFRPRPANGRNLGPNDLERIARANGVIRGGFTP
jgi:hypothetical protein